MPSLLTPGRRSHIICLCVPSAQYRAWHMVILPFLIANNRNQLWLTEAKEKVFIERVLVSLQKWLEDWRMRLWEQIENQPTSGLDHSHSDAIELPFSCLRPHQLPCRTLDAIARTPPMCALCYCPKNEFLTVIAMLGLD